MSKQWLAIVGIAVFAVASASASIVGADPPVIWTVATITACFAVALTACFERWHSKAMNELGAAIRRMGSGEFDLRMYAGGSTAMTALGRAVNSAGDELAHRFSHLETERRQLRAILSGMIEGVVLLDSAQRILFVNERATQLLDLAGPVVGKKVWETIRHRRLQQLVTTAFRADAV